MDGVIKRGNSIYKTWESMSECERSSIACREAWNDSISIKDKKGNYIKYYRI